MISYGIRALLIDGNDGTTSEIITQPVTRTRSSSTIVHSSLKSGATMEDLCSNVVWKNLVAHDTWHFNMRPLPSTEQKCPEGVTETAWKQRITFGDHSFHLIVTPGTGRLHQIPGTQVEFQLGGHSLLLKFDRADGGKYVDLDPKYLQSGEVKMFMKEATDIIEGNLPPR